MPVASNPDIPVYVIKPKFVFKDPFFNFNLLAPIDRQSQSEEITDFFNYGFNEDTMKIYTKLIERIRTVNQTKKNLAFFDKQVNLLKLNDQIPMDHGGFCPLFDPALLNQDGNDNGAQMADKLLEYFVCLSISKKTEHPLLEFIKKMYETDPEDSELRDLVDQVCRNLDKKYEETMIKLNKINTPPAPRATQPGREGKTKNEEGQKSRSKSNQSSSSSSSSSSSGSSSSSSESSSESSEQSAQKKRAKKAFKKETKKHKKDKKRSKRDSKKDKTKEKEKEREKQGGSHRDKEKSKDKEKNREISASRQKSKDSHREHEKSKGRSKSNEKQGKSGKSKDKYKGDDNFKDSHKKDKNKDPKKKVKQ